MRKGIIDVNCTCNMAAKIILQANIHVIVIDAFVSYETEAHGKIISLDLGVK